MTYFRFGKTLVCILCAFCLLVSFSSLASATLTPLNDDTEFVKQVYRDFLNREADAGGLDYWIAALDADNSRAEVVEQYLLSTEFQGNIAPVARLYFAYFNRIPDYDGLMYWVEQFGLGAPLANVSDAFAGSAEFIATYGSLSNQAFVNLVYQNVLGRDPEADGLAYWLGELDSGRATRGQVMTGFSESAEYQALMANKIYVTMTYVGLLRRAPEQGGFDYWVGLMENGTPGLGLIEEFLFSNEYAARFEILNISESLVAGNWVSPLVDDDSRLVLFNDGYIVYYEDDIEPPNGLEVGTYGINGNYVDFYMSYDDNVPDSGLSDTSLLVEIVHSGDRLILSDGEGSLEFVRATQNIQSIEGAWYDPAEAAHLLLGPTKFVYHENDDELPNGVEIGTYINNYDGTVTFTIGTDTNGPGEDSGVGDIGSPPTYPLSLSVDGKTMSLAGGALNFIRQE